jgi:hypothetical protein
MHDDGWIGWEATRASLVLEAELERFAEIFRSRHHFWAIDRRHRSWNIGVGDPPGHYVTFCGACGDYWLAGFLWFEHDDAGAGLARIDLHIAESPFQPADMAWCDFPIHLKACGLDGLRTTLETMLSSLKNGILPQSTFPVTAL